MDTKVADTYPEALAPGTLLGNFVIESVLGQGGGAVTYYCTDSLLGREVALKEHFPHGLCRRGENGRVVPLEGCEEIFEQSVEVFLREAQTVAGLKHPDIVPIHDVLSRNGTAYAVLEYEEGVTLDAWLTAHAHKPRRVQRVLLRLLSVLTYLHERSVYHRDIKPANILVRAGDAPILLDFGAAHVGDDSGLHTIVGTPNFAAPEQFDAEGKRGPWSDLYALGSSFLHGLGAENAAALPRRLRNSLYKATRREPDKRFQTAAEWMAALTRPRRRLLLAAVLFLLLSAGAVCYVMHQASAPSSAVSPAVETADGMPATSSTPVEPAQGTASIEDIPRSLNGYTLHLLLGNNICYQSRADLQHWEQMEERDVIDTLKDAFYVPNREPINARVNPDYFSFGETEWTIGDSHSDYTYKRLEHSAMSLLVVANARKTAKMPYLLWFSSPGEGFMAFPVDNGLNIWSHVRFRLEPTAGFTPPKRQEGSAPESPAGMYLICDLSNAQSYKVAPDTLAKESDAGIDKENLDISPVAAYVGLFFRDGERWECGTSRGTYTYERISPHEAHIMLHGETEKVDISFYLDFTRNGSGFMRQHTMGEKVSSCNVFFEMRPFGVSPHAEQFNLFFRPDDLRPTAAPTAE